MSYRAGEALQAAVYQRLRGDEALGTLVGDAVFDAMPVAAPAGVHVSLGPEEVKDASDATARGALHEFAVTVLSGADQEAGGFAEVKAAAAAVVAALEDEPLALTRGVLAGLWCLKAKAARAETGAARRVDLTFRARVDLAEE